MWWLIILYILPVFLNILLYKDYYEIMAQYLGEHEATCMYAIIISMPVINVYAMLYMIIEHVREIFNKN